MVFLVGMRINRFWRFLDWWAVGRAMVEMIRYLYAHPETGFLSAEYFISMRNRAPVLLTYWKSFEDLNKFARGDAAPHLRSWKVFNGTIGKQRSVGVWHETFLVEPGRFEAIYANMPRFGLAHAGRHVRVSGHNETALRRLGGHDDPVVDVAY